MGEPQRAYNEPVERAAGPANAGKQRLATAVLGCGVIGSSWVEAFVAAGHDVRAWDPDGETRDRLRQHFGNDVRVFETAAEAVAGASFVQESGPENLRVKRDLLFRIAEGVSPEAIIASSTSTIEASALQEGMSFAAQILIGHPVNPPHILPLIEVVGGALTSAEVLQRAMSFYRALGKHPILLKIERPGHLVNRLQAALWREAVDAVASGQADVADVDAAVTLALGPRWAVLGPFATFEASGGTGGLANFLDHLGLPFEALWDDARRPQMTEQFKKKLVAQVTRSFGDTSPHELATRRDECLRDILVAAKSKSNA